MYNIDVWRIICFEWNDKPKGVFFTGSVLKVLENPTYPYFHFFGKDFAISNTKNF